MRLLLILILCTSIAYGQDQIETLDPTQSKLNNSISSFTTREQLLRLLGKPAKVQKANFECALTSEQENAKVQNIYHYGKTRFFIYDKKADLLTIDFKSGKFIYETPKIELSGKTTFEEIDKVYPQATKASLKENQGKIIRIRPCKECDGQVLLYMEKGRIALLEFWEPC